MSYYDNYWDDEFYNEPNEFEQQIYEFKDAIAKSVKDEFIEKMEKLEKENTELQKVKKNFDKIKADYQDKVRELDHQRQELEQNVKAQRLSEILKDFQVELWTVAEQRIKQPKCDKCDEERKIWYTTPLGHRTYEYCDCSKDKIIYVPAPTHLVEFQFRRNTGAAWYDINSDESINEYGVDPDWLSYNSDSISKKNYITSEEQLNPLPSEYQILFKTKELAQKYCDLRK